VPDLVHAVQELYEYGGSFAQLAGGMVAASFLEHVAKGQPVFVDQSLKAVKCSEIRV